MWKLNLIAKRSYKRESKMDTLILPLSLEISGDSSGKVTPKHIREWLMSLPQASPANPSQSQGSNKEKTIQGICGPKRGIPLALFDPSTSSLRMCQGSFLTLISGESYPTLPKWGTIVDGELWAQTTPALLTGGRGGGVWPTPRKQMTGAVIPSRTIDKFNNLESVIARKQWPTPKKPSGGGQIERTTPGGGIRKLEDKVSQSIGKNTGQLNPTWVAWLMGWPLNWESREPLIDLIWLDWSVDPADDDYKGQYPTASSCQRGAHVGREMKGLQTKSITTGTSFGMTQETFAKHNPGLKGRIPRVATGVKDRVNRLKALGNGQVPATVALAWQILSREIK